MQCLHLNASLLGKGSHGTASKIIAIRNQALSTGINYTARRRKGYSCLSLTQKAARRVCACSFSYLFVNKGMAVSRATISSSATSFLNIELDTLGHVIMDNCTDIFFVDPHPKCLCSHHNAYLPLHEVLMNLVTFIWFHATMIVPHTPLHPTLL